MNIHTVAQNLRNTIAGKEQLLKQHYNTLELYKRGAKENTGVEMAINATIQFLDINIDELRRILQDVEVCCEQHTEMGWQINPERMGQ
jgi:hypothetical protein